MTTLGQSKNALFRADGIRCAYRPDQLVLELEHLETAAGELLFVLGRSGIGKSTFLELAGLMNKPSHLAEGVLTLDRAGSEGANILDLWNGSNQRISEFRNRHFSFIFQETNFLEAFNVGENVFLPAMVQGMSFDQAESKAKNFMRSLDLAPELLDKHPHHLSGGQKQRMAFIRALLPDFKILFGDEPTGNLDTATADQLMTILKQELKDGGKAAIVVSHDIRLSVRFADRIAVFTMNEIEGGRLLKEHTFTRDGSWQSENGTWSDSELVSLLDRLIRNER